MKPILNHNFASYQVVYGVFLAHVYIVQSSISGHSLLEKGIMYSLAGPKTCKLWIFLDLLFLKSFVSLYCHTKCPCNSSSLHHSVTHLWRRKIIESNHERIVGSRIVFFSSLFSFKSNISSNSWRKTPGGFLDGSTVQYK